jgi:hypothetical protein
MTSDCAIYGLDIGVYKLGAKSEVLSDTTAAWCRVVAGTSSVEGVAHEGGTELGVLKTPAGSSWRCGRSIKELAKAIAYDISTGRRIALGLEAPTWFPLHAEHRPGLRLFEHRFEQERGTEWYLQAGAAATLKAISLGRLLLGYLTGLGHRLSFATAGDDALVGQVRLFEAFVAGKQFKISLPGLDAANEWDALVAALAFGGVHKMVEVPLDWEPTLLHAAGDAVGEGFSVWNTILRASGADDADGPWDCDVVGAFRSDPVREL